MTARYRAAIIGCGDIGHAHAQGYRLNPDVELVAVVDPLEVARRQFQAEYDIPHAYSTAEELFAAMTPDLVSVCVWHLLHPEVTIAAAEAGVRAIICEKPMAVSLGAVDSMIEACERTGTKLAVSHQRRYTPGWERARELVADGAIGDVRAAHSRGVAGLLNTGTHAIDGMRFVVGDLQPAWVVGSVERDTNRFERDTPIEDCCMVVVELENGSQLIFQSELPWVKPRWRGLRFEGSEGIIEATEGYTRLFNATSGGWSEVLKLDKVDSIGGKANGRLVADVLRWLDGGPEPRCGAAVARTTTEIMMAAYESARRNRVIQLPLQEAEYPLALMISEGALVPSSPEAYDIRAFLRRDSIDEAKYEQLRAEGLSHHNVMLRLAKLSNVEMHG